MGRLRALSVAAVAALVGALTLGVATGSAAALSLKENPFVQQGEKLVASGVSELAEQGSSVAISADGDTALVGALAYKEGHPGEIFRGAVWVYTRSGSVWTQQAKLVGKNASNDAQEGFSVALSADGDTALIGGPQDAGEHEEYYGAVWVFVREGTTWHEQQKLVAKTGATEKGEQGSSVALSADGNTALVGAMDNEYKSGIAPGAAFVFTRSGSTWSQQGSKLEGNHSGELVQEGTSVALSADGHTAVIGGPREEGPSATPEEGGAWVFTESGSGWKEQTQLPAGTGAGIQTGAGQSVAISGDGSTVLVGGPGYDEALGTAWVYTLSGATWTQQGEKLLGEDATLKEAQQGHSVSLSENGNTALIGGYHNDKSVGAAWAFVRSGSTWSEQEQLVGTGSVGGFPTQGSSVALSADGLTSLVGGAGDNGEVGATWVFARTPESGGEPEPPPAKPNEPEPNPNQPPNTSTGGPTSTSGGSSSTGANHPPPPPPSTSPSIIQREEHLASAFGLPSAKLCFSRRSFKIHIQQPPGYPRIVSAEVFLGHKRERSLNKHGLTAQVVLT